MRFPLSDPMSISRASLAAPLAVPCLGGASRRARHNKTWHFQRQAGRSVKQDRIGNILPKYIRNILAMWYRYMPQRMLNCSRRAGVPRQALAGRSVVAVSSRPQGEPAAGLDGLIPASDCRRTITVRAARHTPFTRPPPRSQTMTVDVTSVNATSGSSARVAEFMDQVMAKNPGEVEFHQAVREVAESVMPFIDAHPVYRQARILERLVEPERVLMFRVPWLDDRGEIQVNRGFRIQMSSAIGPYKGGLRFHPDRHAGRAQVPGVRAGLQELADDAAHGWWQRRLGFRPEGQERQRGDAVLPVVHDGTLPPYRTRYGRAGGRHRCRRPRDRLSVRPVQTDRQSVLWSADRQRLRVWRFAAAARGHRLRLRVFCPGNARRRVATVSRAKRHSCRDPATWPSTPWRS